jgi:hypothetical protein
VNGICTIDNIFCQQLFSGVWSVLSAHAYNVSQESEIFRVNSKTRRLKGSKYAD